MTQDTIAQTLDPVAVPAGQGEALWWFGMLAEVKATAEDTGGQLSIVEITCPAGFEAPLHVHHIENESFWIIEGELTFYVGDGVIEAKAGDYVFGPSEVPHRFTVGSSGCRMLFILTPGGFEQMVRELAVPAGARTVPPPSEEEPDWGRIATIVKAHGNELLV